MLTDEDVALGDLKYPNVRLDSIFDPISLLSARESLLFPINQLILYFSFQEHKALN